MTYRWAEESRAVAKRFDFVARAAEIAGRDPPVALRDALLSALAALVERLLGEVRLRVDQPA